MAGITPHNTRRLVSIWTALKPVCLATAPLIRASLLTIFTAWALKNQSNFDRVINIHHFQLQGEFLGNLQCCNSFTRKKIVSYIKAEDGPVFTVYSEVVISKTKHSKTKTEARSPQNSKTKHPISKTKHPKLENEAPKTRKRRPLNLENEAP